MRPKTILMIEKNMDQFKKDQNDIFLILKKQYIELPLIN